MKIGVPLVIFHPPTARGIETPHGSSSVCLSNRTVQTARPDFATCAGQQQPWQSNVLINQNQNRNQTFSIFWISYFSVDTLRT